MIDYGVDDLCITLSSNFKKHQSGHFGVLMISKYFTYHRLPPAVTGEMIIIHKKQLGGIASCSHEYMIRGLVGTQLARTG